MQRRILLAAGVLAGLLVSAAAYGWGGAVHRFLNRGSFSALPRTMVLFIQDSARIVSLAGDADSRKVSDDTSFFAESTRHYIDIDDYPDFRNLPRDVGAAIALYGWTRVKDNGVLPWAIQWCYDSLVAQLRRGEWSRATATASDLGHYVGDAQQPLHATKNYDGQSTNNGGIHSRYESTMLGTQYYYASLAVLTSPARSIDDRSTFAFEVIVRSNALADSILHGDDRAKAISGWNGKGSAPAAYYAALWDATRDLTLDQLRRAAQGTADLWYSAWVDAGLIQPSAVERIDARPADFGLVAAYPNPVTARTTIAFSLPVGGTGTLELYSAAGNRIAAIAQGELSAGRHEVIFDGSPLPAGVYLLRLRLGVWEDARKVVVLR
jgi:hypothetical protein